jgi:hypothetical protein
MSLTLNFSRYTRFALLKASLFQLYRPQYLELFAWYLTPINSRVIRLTDKHIYIMLIKVLTPFFFDPSDGEASM